MSKWYEVILTTVKVVVVEVRDDQDQGDALDIAISEFDADEAEARDIPIASEYLDSYQRHADEVMPLEQQ